jgi:uncharacterized membrane protein
MKHSINNAYQQNTMWNQQIQQITPLTTAQISSMTASYNLANSNSLNNTVNYPSISAINLNDIIKSTTGYHDGKYVKTYQIIEAVEDLLALSVAHKRLLNEKISLLVKSFSFKNILDSVVFENLNDNDREIANTIRKYYSQQILMWALKGIKLTAFREDLKTYINGEGNKFVENTIPLVTKLPYFYEYDIKLDEIKREFTTDIERLNPAANTPSKHSYILTPIKSLSRKTKRVKCIEYWLKDNYNQAYKIEIEHNNPLQHLWDKIFNSNKLEILCYTKVKRLDDLNYFHIFGWEVL